MKMYADCSLVNMAPGKHLEHGTELSALLSAMLVFYSQYISDLGFGLGIVFFSAAVSFSLGWILEQYVAFLRTEWHQYPTDAIQCANTISSHDVANALMVFHTQKGKRW